MAIINRFSLKNFLLPLDRATDIERMDDFLMVRTPPGAVDGWHDEAPSDGQSDVWGLWIYAEEDRQVVERVCKTLLATNTLLDTNTDRLSALFTNAIIAYKAKAPTDMGAYT
ncbi:uncharacterized protein V1510DRAFT_413952 [Dipodascopsis tothii]|uniref:uncharacterized protein n=1 Tax=Dipodascopsis tothii TaxID=44089 RepID=UPI0034CF0E3F